mgnify:CR=1 FL=1
MKTTIETHPKTRSERREKARLSKRLIRTDKRKFVEVVASRSKNKRKNERISKEERWQLLCQ